MKENSNIQQVTYDQIKKCDVELLIHQDNLVVALINDSDEWKALCSHLSKEYDDTKYTGFDVLPDEPLSYPAIISFNVTDHFTAIRIGNGRTFEKNDKGEIVREKVRTINGKEYAIYNDHPVLDIVSKLREQADAIENFVKSLNL